MAIKKIVRALNPFSLFQESILHVLLSAIIAASILAFPLDFIEAPLFDLRQTWSLKPKADDQIVLITLDDESAIQLNDIQPLSLTHHQTALSELEKHKVRAIGYALDFNNVERIDSEAFKTTRAQEFARTAVRMNANGTPVILGVPFDLSGEVPAPAVLNAVPQAVALTHRDGTLFGKDKVTRRALVSLYDRFAFEMALANRIRTHEETPNPPGTYRATDTEAEYFLFKLHQTNGTTYDSDYETFSYPRYSFVDLVEGRIPYGTLEGKIILIGSYQRENPNDFTLIASQAKHNLMPKILVHANVLDSIINKQGTVPVSSPWTAGYSFLLSLTIILASLRIRPSRLMWLTVGLLVFTLALGFLMFQPIPVLGNHWMNLSRPLIALVLSFYLMIPLRLYSEHRKRFALEKQNQFLIEVESMKTNFLQLVTHDLKTPIARMQGLTESLKRSIQGKLENKEIDLFSHMFGAIEELNQFINALLELSKLETLGVPVQLQSRDINHLLEDIVLKHRFAAQAKNIQIHTNFEPLFPFKFDADLIGKVLSNLVDNAIKYSPDQTQITLTTVDEGERVKIIVDDEGIGIPEAELSHLFSRFYRIKNDTTQQVKGTGLGLYLSRYFIEAHNGTIDVQRRELRGTRITVTLPTNLQLVNTTIKALPTKPKENLYA